MKRVIDASEVLGTVGTRDGDCEVCAAATANYDEASGRLVVSLDSFLRRADLRAPEARIPADWLPKSETLSESVDPAEGAEAARDIFHRWVRKVRQAAPSWHHPAA